MLFLLAAGLTLVFGIMDMINLAHGSLYMVGAYCIASVAAATGSFWMGLAGGVVATAVFGILLEVGILRKLYARDHLSQVLGTFAILLMCNEAVRLIWGAQPISLNPPEALSGPVELLPGLMYPAYRLLIIGVGLLVALLLYLLITRTRVGMQVRAGASNRDMAMAMGSHVQGFLGALLVGFVDTAGRTLVPMVFDSLLSPEAASNAGPAVASILIYVLMATVLFFKPRGLFPTHG
jgi:branched-chain amino acid transport system permease protein